MKTIKVSEATPIQLDWLVAKCEGKNGVLHDDGITRCIVVAAPSGVYKGTWKPTINWSQGGPLIEREGLQLTRCNDLYFPKGNEQGDYYEQYWRAEPSDMDSICQRFYGPTPLIAAMRCYVASKMGDVVEVPEELT